MTAFFQQLRWQFVLLQKNNIVGISIGVTLIYAAILYFLRDNSQIDKVLVALVLNDPSVIGYFFIALAFYTEKKHHLLAPLFITPVRRHIHLLARVLALSIVGVLCSLGLAVSVALTDLYFTEFILGSFGICALSILLGIIMMRYSDEFLKFSMLSAPVFLLFINLPLIQYLGAVDLGFGAWLLPIQGSLDLIDFGISGGSYRPFYVFPVLLILLPVFYFLAYRTYYEEVLKAS
ncbi:hypothetical protein [Flavilitoribacter nigricans]|uniref:ABC transporter permease n=1 Tax=Flavilitoribacter nigricans (strain ATCC 23147 / DSM 23189 / NBRC 102662 / NCIMB 1420 / SS-2) TaxID=1122177 RepID=A0A2D0N190_FLAN2|nr:hypothetical protein [Flavilitoribacter nigricans]PHN02301.1 hypothetical protein CRP01_32910 [Flavilitoribacter nigricans DSM 23189 = NBRC 102662]